MRVPRIGWLPVCLAWLVVACTPAPRDTPPVQGRLRIATWNIRFFPNPDTDVERTAEILAGLDADLVAVQEIADSTALRRMIARAGERLRRDGHPDGTARDYAHVLSATGGHGGQYVGFVYDRNAVELRDVRTLTSLQMTPDLRPALYAYVRSRRGGLDFHVIVNHTDSGTKIRDYTHRMEFLDSLAVEVGRLRQTEADIVVLGDLNTMGHLTESGVRQVTAEEEIAILDRKTVSMGLARLDSDPWCTEYYRGRGSLLDHILVAAAMREVPIERVARVSGYCAASGCGTLDPDAMPYDYTRVSDHCPVVIDLIDQDWD